MKISRLNANFYTSIMTWSTDKGHVDKDTTAAENIWTQFSVSFLFSISPIHLKSMNLHKDTSKPLSKHKSYTLKIIRQKRINFRAWKHRYLALDILLIWFIFSVSILFSIPPI